LSATAAIIETFGIKLILRLVSIHNYVIT
jgi:hypothetical protein